MNSSAEKFANFSAAAEKNKRPILDKLQQHLHNRKAVLEIGSGSGQHALFFARKLTHLSWQPTETAEQFAVLQNNLKQHGLDNLQPALLLDAGSTVWPVTTAENIFSANTLHIMPWPTVEAFFAGVGRVLQIDGLLCIYGALRYNGAFTAESNAAFDRWLKRQNPGRGVRDFTAVEQLAQAQGLELLIDHAMPSNNQLLIWQRRRGN